MSASTDAKPLEMLSSMPSLILTDSLDKRARTYIEKSFRFSTTVREVIASRFVLALVSASVPPRVSYLLSCGRQAAKGQRTHFIIHHVFQKIFHSLCTDTCCLVGKSTQICAVSSFIAPYKNHGACFRPLVAQIKAKFPSIQCFMSQP